MTRKHEHISMDELFASNVAMLSEHSLEVLVDTGEELRQAPCKGCCVPIPETERYCEDCQKAIDAGWGDVM